jgi:uncharacterized phage protein (TIGR01671 family)
MEIKFRAWDKELKHYSKTATEHPIRDINFLTDYEWEQFTGLLDKNKKEIYENDITKFYGKYIGFITYRIGGFFFEESNGRHTPLQILNPLDCEVIGNIHEEVK